MRKRWTSFLEESVFLRQYLWKYRRFIAIGLLALVTVDALEVIPPIILKNVVDEISAGTTTRALIQLAVAYFGVALLQAVCRYGWRMYLIRTSLLASRDLRNRFSTHLFGLSAAFFDRRKIGDLMSLATSDVEAVRMMIGAGILTLADALFYFLFVPVALYLLSPELMLLAFIPLPIIPLIVMRNEREIHLRFARVQECLSRLSALTQESLSGARIVKGFAAENVQLRRFRDVGDELRRLSMSLARVQTAFGPILDFTMSLGLAFLLFFGGRQLIGGSNALTIGVFVAFQRYIQQMVWPMAAIGMALSFYRRSATSTQRLQNVFNETSDVEDVANPKLPVFLSNGGLPRTAGGIEFKDLHFRFPGSSTDVLHGITLKIEPGERIALIGAVGSGKSALLSLLPRLRPVSRGMLFIDGVDVNDWPLVELRRQVGYVAQDVFLFSETVAENVAFGLHDWVERSSGMSDVIGAAELAGVHDDVLGLVSRYETMLGERGVNLSGGQKQRLTIARALAKEPSIFVMDDALSSVDFHTEEKILKSLSARPGRNTEIIAAHRISTIRNADRIVVLSHGVVVQMGSHARLIAESSGLYRKLYEQQLLKDDIDRYLALEQERS